MISFWTLKYLSMYNMTFGHPNDYTKIIHDKGRLVSRRLHQVPDSLDWRDYNVVGPVHKQLDCNSCWAFASAGSIEYWLKRMRPTAEVNVQNILDCAPHTYGCMGGLMEHAFEYKGYYPLGYNYLDAHTQCKPASKGVHVKDHVSIERQIEASLPHMLYKWGPVTIAVDFSRQHNYKGGIILAKDCSNSPKHAVLAVGYTPSYWIIKNSMGEEWGDKGYAYVERNTGACGIETYASVSTGIDIL